MTAGGAGWEGLDPWEKIVQWKEVAPEISDEILQLAKARAIQSRRSQVAAEKAEMEAAKFERETRAEQDRRAHELATFHAARQFELAGKRQIEQYKLANRMWWTQLVGMTGGLILIALLVVAALVYSPDASLGPGIAILGMGSALTAGVYGLNRNTRKSLQALAAPSEAPRIRRDEGGPLGGGE